MTDRDQVSHLGPQVTWKDITDGCAVYGGGTSKAIKTGDWRVIKPIFNSEKCRQCALCIPVCPDMSIPVDGEGNRLDFDYYYCKGCGICARVCPFDAITMEKN